MYLCNVFQSQSSNLAISAFDTFFSKSSTILLCFFANFLYVLPLGRPICFPSARTLFNDSLVLSEISWRSISLAREKAKASIYNWTYADEQKAKNEWNPSNEEENPYAIFDYIPPQKTNQIYTPKKVVIEMVDMLEQENPNCFDDENKTFIDLYMKSGLYITEIVKRLYRSEKLKKLYPDRIERLKHIFEKQVYGLAPTEIIYRIAIAFILGFDDTILIKKHNLQQFDTLPSVQAGTLETDLDEVFG